MNKLLSRAAIAGALLALSGIAAAAQPVHNVKQTVTDIGTVDYLTDYQPNTDGTVTWTLTKNQPAGSDIAFTDIYSFSLDGANDVTGSAQVVNAGNNNFSLAGAVGELSLYEGSFVTGTSLSTYTLDDQIAFGVTGASLTEHLAIGDYFFVVSGKTSGQRGGKYALEVTAVPEPGYAALLLAGLGVLAVIGKRRKIG